MAIDPREAIMARLLVVIGAAIGGGNVSRNELYDDDAGDTHKRVSLLEGDEVAAEEDGLSRRAVEPYVIYMQPQVLLSNFDTSSSVGAGLSATRAAIIKAIAADTQLTELTHKNMGIRYIGMESDLAFARDALGRMALKFRAPYVLLPNRL